MEQLSDYIKAHSIRMECQRAERNPNMLDDRYMTRHFRCRLEIGTEPDVGRLDVFFSQGSAHTHDPTLEDVLDCLASDAAGIVNASGDFSDWCSEYGYDDDSRITYRTFEICTQQAEELRTFLGDDLFEVLLFETERA